MNLEYRDLNRNDGTDIQAFLPVFWEFWLRVNGEDLSTEIEEDFCGHKVKLTKAEMAVYGYLESGFRIRLCLVDGKTRGFIIYRVVCAVVLEVRAMYLETELLDKGMGKQMLNSIEMPIQKIVFQTRVERPPLLFLNQTESRRRKLGECKGLITWEMDWEREVRQ